MMWTLPPVFNRLMPAAQPKRPAPPAGGTLQGVGQARQIPMTNTSQYIKDPGFAHDGKPIGGQRYAVFGNLRQFFLKGFSLKGAAGQRSLNFEKTELPIRIAGLSARLDGLWAPQVVVKGNRVQLLFCAGEMPAGGGIRWGTFRLHAASMPLDEFVRQAESGGPVTFQHQGALFQDQRTFAGNSNFAMIDPELHTSPNGRTFMTYTVVQHADGTRPHQEFVRYREVDPAHPTRPIGPDLPMVDGFAGGRHAGVAEAQDLVNISGQTYALISSRAGDIDQQVLVAPVGRNLGRIDERQLKPILQAGSQPWKSHAVGSTGTAVIAGQIFSIFQGLDAARKFHLGVRELKLGRT